MRAWLWIVVAGCWSSSTTQPKAMQSTATPVEASTAAPAPQSPPPPPPPPLDAAPATDRKTLRLEYFAAVRNAVEAKWNPKAVWQALPAERRAKPPGMTVVQFGIADDGSVTASVTKSCGVAELDSEAAHSIEVAGPFQPPPSWLTPVMVDARFTFGVDQPSSLQFVPY